MYILKTGVVSVSTKLVYKDYTRHPLDRDEWQVTRKKKTILAADKLKIDQPGQVFGLGGVTDPTRFNNCTYEADSVCDVLMMPIAGMLKTANSTEIQRLIE